MVAGSHQSWLAHLKASLEAPVGNQVIKPVMSTPEFGGKDVEILGGLYNMTLPKTIFNQKGFYTIYIRPAQIRLKIEDCAELATYPDVKGLVFNIYPENSKYLKIRKYYSFYLMIYLMLFVVYLCLE